ncbi:MAG: PQQ-like beta-propeller repeat protein [Candidatus Latescibacteria bacterium]|nr:PQQ-like beta-propeller repeat protein [Candidatus Latescibacterota bacterium]
MRKIKRMLNSQYKIKFNTIFGNWKSLLHTGFILCLLACLFCKTPSAQEKSEWPYFHGMYRNNKSAETGLLKEWPENGPELLWTVSGLGSGFSTASIAKGYIFTAGRIGKQTYVFAYDMYGKLLWKKPNGFPSETTKAFGKSNIGSRSTPTYDDGIVYHLDEFIQLTAFDYKTGKKIWYLNLREIFDAELPDWGFSPSVLIEGDRLYCSPGGKKGFMVCLNKKDGKLIWVCRDIPGTAGHSTPIFVEFGGYHQLINMSSNSVYGVDRKTGKLLWNSKFENRVSINVTDAIFHNGYVFISSGYGIGSELLKLKASGERIVPETVWKSDLMDNHHGGVILHKGYLYGAGHDSRGWFCLDFMTGKQMWKSRGKGSLFYADDMFYFLEEKGTMKLVKATHEKYDELSSFEVPEGGKGMYWAHPVVCGGRLYVRHADKLYVYDIKSK